MLSTLVLGTAIILAPFGIGLAIGGDPDGILVCTIMGSLPILIGVIAQRTKGRTGAGWWFLSFVMMSFFFLDSATSAATRHEEALYIGLADALLWGALPMLILVATVPRRHVDDDVIHTAHTSG